MNVKGLTKATECKVGKPYRSSTCGVRLAPASDEETPGQSVMGRQVRMTMTGSVNRVKGSPVPRLL